MYYLQSTVVVMPAPSSEKEQKFLCRMLTIVLYLWLHVSPIKDDCEYDEPLCDKIGWKQQPPTSSNQFPPLSILALEETDRILSCS